MERPNFYAIIPANIRYNKNLSAEAKLFYAEITALCNAEGYCWAKNKYFAEFFGVDDRTIQRWLLQLKNSGAIFIKVFKSGLKTVRHIYITPPPPDAKPREKSKKVCDDDISKSHTETESIDMPTICGSFNTPNIGIVEKVTEVNELKGDFKKSFNHDRSVIVDDVTDVGAYIYRGIDIKIRDQCNQSIIQESADTLTSAPERKESMVSINYSSEPLNTDFPMRGKAADLCENTRSKESILERRMLAHEFTHERTRLDDSFVGYFIRKCGVERAEALFNLAVLVDSRKPGNMENPGGYLRRMMESTSQGIRSLTEMEKRHEELGLDLIAYLNGKIIKQTSDRLCFYHEDFPDKEVSISECEFPTRLFNLVDMMFSEEFAQEIKRRN